MNIFLSYSDEDWQIAGFITERLDRQGHNIFNWRTPGLRGGRFRPEIEEAIRSADVFLALLSPSFLQSDWCNREIDMALQRERAQRDDDPNATFIIVAKVTQVTTADAGTLASYDLLDMTSSDHAEAALRVLAGRFESATQPNLDHSLRQNPDPSPFLSVNGQEEELVLSNNGEEPVFRNRVDELHRVLLGLTNAGGPHFWLVVSPPQLGKSWFLRRVGTDDSLVEPVPWVIRSVDIRMNPPGVRSDVAALLELLFEHTSSEADEETLFSIAQAIIRTGRPHLCMLDSAELLAEETVSSLRESLSQIYHLVQDAGVSGLRLAFIVASRRDDDWKGVTPPPRLAPLPLTEFHTDVVEQALHDLADEMGLQIPAWRIRENAIPVYRLTEGLPALLVRCLQWIRTNQWVAMERRLEDPRRFEELAVPYIQHELLTSASLLPASQADSHAQMQALIQSYRVLTLYRLFTQSHLRHYLESDDKFRATLAAAGWVLQDLWRAIGETALLRRPLNEPWQEIHAAIRRLLYRYFYRTDSEREQAHSEARLFVELWSDGQVGTEQVIGMVECLWHESVAVGPRNSAEMERRLTESARKLSGSLRESSAFTLPELRAFVGERMTYDEELREAVSGVGGLFGRLIDIVERPVEL
jgi:hypothetical protein